MPNFHHGVTLTESDSGTRSIREVSTDVIGFVATADDANEDIFPLNTPVLFTGGIDDAIAAAGTGGTLRNVLEVIKPNVNPTMVIVRVGEAADEAEQTANVIGSVEPDGTPTGMQALISAESALGVRPKILGAPYLATQAVTTALVAVAKKLSGFVYARAVAETKEEAVAYVQNFGQRELMIMWPDFKAFDVDAEETVAVDPAAVALGMRAAADAKYGWHKSISNITIDGVTGISKPLSFDLLDPNTDVGYLNAGNVTTIVRQNGFRFWGNRTPSDDSRFQFECYTRTAQVVGQSIALAQIQFMDKPLTAGLLTDIVETNTAKLHEWEQEGRLVGGAGVNKAYLTQTNSAQTLKDGKLYYAHKYNPVAPFEHAIITQVQTDEGYMQLAQSSAA